MRVLSSRLIRIAPILALMLSSCGLGSDLRSGITEASVNLARGLEDGLKGVDPVASQYLVRELLTQIQETDRLEDALENTQREFDALKRADFPLYSVSVKGTGSVVIYLATRDLETGQKSVDALSAIASRDNSVRKIYEGNAGHPEDPLALTLRSFRDYGFNPGTRVYLWFAAWAPSRVTLMEKRLDNNLVNTQSFGLESHVGGPGQERAWVVDSVPLIVPVIE